MAVQFSDLLTKLTRENVVARILGVLQAAGFPVTSWGSTSIPRILIESFAEVAVEISATIVSIAQMVTLETAEGDALTLHAKDAYDEDRKPALPTKGTRTLVESAGNPQSWAAGELVIVSASDATLVYRNVDGADLAANGSLAVTFAAEAPGSKYNVDGAELGELATPVPGVAITATTGSGWIAQEGTDEESDEALRVRCRAKWGTLAAAAPEDAYRAWALKSSSEITKVHVQEDPLAVPPTPAVRTYVASDAGSPTSGAVTAADAYIQARRPLGTLVAVSGALASLFDLRGVVYVLTAYRATAEPAVKAALRAYFASLGIGSQISISQIIEVVMAVPGVVNFVPKNAGGTNLVPGTDDVVTAGNEVPVLVSTDLLTWTNV